MNGIYTIDEIKSIVAPIARDYEIDLVYLFGSYARGEATEESDIDLLIKGFKSKKPWAYPGLFVDMEEAFNKKVDIVSVEALNASSHEWDFEKRFKYSLKKERIVIYEEQK
jgi:predicted nucleotidyltransferase